MAALGAAGLPVKTEFKRSGQTSPEPEMRVPNTILDLYRNPEYLKGLTQASQMSQQAVVPPQAILPVAR